MESKRFNWSQLSEKEKETTMSQEKLMQSGSELRMHLGIRRSHVCQLSRQLEGPAAKIGKRALVQIEGLKSWLRKNVERRG